MKIKLAGFGFVLAVSACAPLTGEQGEERTDAASGETVISDVPSRATPSESIILSGSEQIGSIRQRERLKAFATEDGGIRISGTDERKNAAGRTSGITVMLPDAIEQRASGKTVLVSVTGRAFEGETSTLDIAYATNDVGSSGWQTLTFGAKSEVQSFEYDVRAIREGNGDFIAFSTNEGEVVIESLSLRILD